MPNFGLILLLLAMPFLGSCMDERDINTECVEVALKDSDDINKAMDGCYMPASDELHGSSSTLEDIKAELRKLTHDYAAALKKDKQNDLESRIEKEAHARETEARDAQEQSEELDKPESSHSNAADPFGWGSRRRFSTRRRSASRRRSTTRRRLNRRRSWFRRRSSSIRRRTWRRRSSGRPGTPTVNGCSIPLGLYFPYKRAFTPSCNRHDVCYYKERYGRSSCDRTFYRNMLNKCQSYGGGFKRSACRGFAGIYYRAVRGFGKSHYG